MGKRKRGSRMELKICADCARSRMMGKDKISQVPDEVLVSILSLLTMKEAARTSVLSHRWRNLWTCIPFLNFDASEMLRLLEDQMFDDQPTPESYKNIIIERQRYVHWVSHVLKSYPKSTKVDEFRVRFDLDAHYRKDIDTWLKFAIKKKVKCLIMDFEPVNGLKIRYPFPTSRVTFRNLYSSLRKLHLKYIDIDQNVIECLISACTHLEELLLVRSASHRLVHLNVDGQSLCLKHLKIHRCSNLKSIYLSAPNLTSFEFIGEEADISYANVPNLVEVSVGYLYMDFILHNFGRLSNYVVRLETLILNMSATEKSFAYVEYPELPHLKNLKLDICAKTCGSLLVFAPLIKAAHSLCRIQLKIVWAVDDEWERKKVKKAPKCAHQCLKEVEILGFEGRVLEMELASYLIENAVMLEKIIISPPLTEDDYFMDDPFEIAHQRAMKGAMRLKSKHSLGDKLVTRNFQI